MARPFASAVTPEELITLPDDESRILDGLPGRCLVMAMRDSLARIATPLAIALYAGVIFWVTASHWSQGRWDYYYLADAFLHGRLWIPVFDRTIDAVVVDAHAFLPFAPFPAVVLMPLVWLVGVAPLLPWEQTINVVLAATAVALCWVLLGRVGGTHQRGRLWLVVLFAFSTPVWSVTVLGGPWHFAQLLATILTLLGLIECWGARRGWVLGAIAAASFLTRPTLIFGVPFWLAVAAGGRELRLNRIEPSQLWRAAAVAVPVVLGIAITLWYNAARFGSPFESGYALAALPPQLAGTRDHGLFSIAYLPRNLDYLVFAPPVAGASPWFLHPTGYGLSVLLTSPALLLSLLADFRQRMNIALAATALAVLLPSLLYYGGGWFQLGFRYFLDSIPFVIVLAASGATRSFGWPWKVLIGFGTLVSLVGILWAYSAWYA